MSEGPLECYAPPTYKVVLLQVGRHRLGVMKAIRHLWPEVNLSEAKRLIEGTPVQLRDGVEHVDVDRMGMILFRAGASVQFTDFYGRSKIFEQTAEPTSPPLPHP